MRNSGLLPQGVAETEERLHITGKRCAATDIDDGRGGYGQDRV
jgi:hypothetical protein